MGEFCEHGVELNAWGGLSDECSQCMEETGGWETCCHGNTLNLIGLPDCPYCEVEDDVEGDDYDD